MTYRFEHTGRLPSPMRLEFPEGDLRVTEWPTVQPEPGGPLWQSYGVCAHPNFDNAAYGDTDAWTQKLADLGVYAFRGMCASQLDHVKRTLDRCKDLGLKWLATVASEQTSEKQLRANLDFVAANPDVFIAVEGINEPDGEGLTDAELMKTVRFQRIIWDYVNAHPELAHITVLSPALRRPAGPKLYQRFADAGMLGTYHVVSMHYYTGTQPLNVAELQGHMGMVEGLWKCGRFWITETGSTNATESTDPRRATEEVSAAYSVPNIFRFLSVPGIEKIFRYEALDDDGPLTNNEAHFGLWRADGSPKPEVDHLSRWIHSVQGDQPSDPLPVDLEVDASDGVETRLVQAAGPPWLWLYRPGATIQDLPVEVRVSTPNGTRSYAVANAGLGVPLEV